MHLHLHTEAHFRRHPFIRIIRARPRLIACALFGFVLIVGLNLATTWREQTQLLIAWNLSIGTYLVLAWTMMFQSNEERMKFRAKIQDEGQVVVLTLTIVAASACMTAIVAELSGLKDLSPSLRGLHVGLAALTILTAWLFVHTMFALHYAHDYYGALMRGGSPCLQFPGECERPGYSDFLYFAFIIGTSGQTADVALASKPMRRLGLLHCVLSFIFNTTLLALTINIAAGMIS
jgi:uncharacterized membrane protein